MNNYIFFMHDDAPRQSRHEDDKWNDYFAKLREPGHSRVGGRSVMESAPRNHRRLPPSLGRSPATFESELRT